MEEKSFSPVVRPSLHFFYSSSSHLIHQEMSPAQCSNTSHRWQCLTTCAAATHSSHHQPSPGLKPKLRYLFSCCNSPRATNHSPHNCRNVFQKRRSEYFTPCSTIPWLQNKIRTLYYSLQALPLVAPYPLPELILGLAPPLTVPQPHWPFCIRKQSVWRPSLTLCLSSCLFVFLALSAITTRHITHELMYCLSPSLE